MALFGKQLPALFPKKGAGPAIAAAKQSTAIATKAVPLIEFGPENFWLPKGADNTDTPIGVRRAYRAFALIYACMEFRATKLVEPPVWIAQEADDGEAMLEGEHPLSELLEQPNPDMEMAEFLKAWSLYRDYGSRVLIVLNRDRTGTVRSMYPYSRDEFTVEAADGRMWGKFRVNTADGYRTLGPADVIYFPSMSPEGWQTAVSPADAALEHVNIGANLRAAIRAIMRNAVNPSLILRAGDLGEATFNRLSTEVRANWGGVTNQGKAITLEAIEEAIIREPSLKNLALGEVNDDVEAAICQTFQIHPLLVGAKLGMQANSGFADSVGPAQKLFYDIFARPSWSALERKFTRALLRPIDDNPRRFIRFDLSKVGALREDMTNLVTQATGAKDFWTEAEQRAHTGKDGGSDELPSERAARVQEEMDAAAEANGDDDEAEEQTAPKLRIAKNRIVDLVKTENGYRATVHANGNGNH
jgi:HK97 family phage portal protein